MKRTGANKSSPSETCRRKKDAHDGGLLEVVFVGAASALARTRT